MAQRLTDKHPLSIKVDKLMGFLGENNLSITDNGFNGLLIEDTVTGVTVTIRDLDDGSPVTDLPAMFEYKLIIVE